MKRAVMMLLAIAMSGAWGMAQVVNPRTIQAIEVEAGLGTGVGLYKVGFDKVSLARSVKAEIRYNFPSGAFDIGFGGRIMRMDRYPLDEPLHKVSYASWQLYGVFDYNWRITDRFVVFAGLAAGFSQNINLINQPSDVYQPRSTAFFLAPRIGFEAWDRLRLTLSCNLMDKGHSFIGLEVGYSFGGKHLQH